MSCLAKDWSDPAISAKYQSARAETTKHAEALRKAVAAKHVDMIAAETWWLLSDPAPKTYFALKLGRSRKVKSKSPSWCLKHKRTRFEFTFRREGRCHPPQEAQWKPPSYPQLQASTPHRPEYCSVGTCRPSPASSLSIHPQRGAQGDPTRDRHC